MLINQHLSTVSRWVKNEKLLIPFLFLITFIIRFQFINTLKNDPAFLLPIIDCEEFNFWALRILEHGPLWQKLNNHTPLYMYFVVLIYKIFGYGTLKVVLFQYLIGTFCTILVYFLTKKLLDQPTAIVASFFIATYWFFIYTQSFLYSENLSMFLNLVLIYILLLLKDHQLKYFLSGVVLGLSVICRPDIFLFIFFILIWLLSKKFNNVNLARFYALFILGVFIIVGPVMWRNHAVSGQWLLRAQIGANIYMGNNPDFKGTNIYVERGKKWYDLITTPHRELNVKSGLTEAQSNQVFIKKTLEIIQKNPLQWLQLIGAKTFSFLTGREFLRSEDVYFFEQHINSTPYRFITTKLIFILALLGFVLSLKNANRFILLYVFIFSEMFIVFFPLKTRYLIPIIPFFIIFSAYAISSLYEFLMHQKWKSVIFITIGFLTLSFLSSLNPLRIHRPTVAEAYFAIADNFELLEMSDEALKYYHKAITVDPQNLSVRHALGMLYLDRGELDKALKSFENALSIDHTAEKSKFYYEYTKKLINEKKSSQ